MAIVLAKLTHARLLGNQRLKVYLIVYCVYRFLTEMIRPEPAAWAGLTFYQGIVAVFATGLIAQWLGEMRGARRSHAADASVGEPGASVRPEPAFPRSSGVAMQQTPQTCSACLRA